MFQQVAIFIGVILLIVSAIADIREGWGDCPPEDVD